MRGSRRGGGGGGWGWGAVGLGSDKNIGVRIP